MRVSILFILLTLTAATTTVLDSDKDTGYTDLIGVWDIDLTAAPGAEPAFTIMEITKIKDNRIYGTFYGANIENGYINTQWGRTVVAFVTRDGSSMYYTSFTQAGDELKGSTLSPERRFLSAWSGKKKK